MDLHPDIRIRKATIGAEQSPLLVIDNFVADAQSLLASAAAKPYAHFTRYYPGVRAKAPLSYQQLFVSGLKTLLMDYFQITGASFRFSMCHYSLLTTPPEKLVPVQRIPHVDSLARDGLATIHYLFTKNLGGTAFYRHRHTGFEYVDESRWDTYFKCLQQESDGPDSPAPAYINGNTVHFEQIAKEDGVFNRMLVYRRNSLHSGCVGPDFVPDDNPLTGRLSINSFLDVSR